MLKLLYTRLLGLHVKMAIFTAAVFIAKWSYKMSIYTTVGLQMQMVICTAAVSKAKMPIYLAARPTYENSYMHSRRFQNKTGYIHGCRTFIWNGYIGTQRPFSKQKCLYTRLPRLIWKWLYTRQPFSIQKSFIYTHGSRGVFDKNPRVCKVD